MGRKIFRILLVLMFMSAVLWGLNHLVPDIFTEGTRNQQKKPVKIPDTLRFVLLGVDYRASQSGARSDTIIFVNIDFKRHQIQALSIPRDTGIDIPGRSFNKINVAYSLGGPALTVATVERLLGVPVKYFLETDFAGFVNIVDTLGGVTVDVEKRMYYRDDLGTIDLYPGVQRLNGARALQYVRFRHDKLGDISRTRRQLNFIRALGHELLQPTTLTKLPVIVPEIKQAVKTNLPNITVINLIRATGFVKEENLLTQTLPGRFANIKGVSYWVVEPREAQEVTKKLLRGIVTPEIIKK